MNANYLHAGDQVAVIYPRTFPHHARAANMSTLLFVPMVLSIAAIVAAGAGYVFWMVGGSL